MKYYFFLFFLIPFLGLIILAEIQGVGEMSDYMKDSFYPYTGFSGILLGTYLGLRNPNKLKVGMIPAVTLWVLAVDIFTWMYFSLNEALVAGIFTTLFILIVSKFFFRIRVNMA